ncbi:MAG: hypothetical protein H6897_02160 [Rhodobacteraceae bacterium]|jgi:hypothetical protein|nr:hypothetical protein [uncultured Defluviimonas sp.]MCB2125039.1 hypothetical protein [Paracoccaceae bacterium]MCC0068715.1 hypothetical protein [Paracoccaceae bacterium]
MTTRIALFLVVLIVLFFVVDALWLHLGAPLFLARKFADFVEWLAFWR